MADAMSRTSRSSFAHGRNSINGQINFTSITINIKYSPQQDQYIFVSPSSQRRNILISFIFPAMVELLQLMYQPSNTSPFEIHPINMYLSVTSFLIYCFAYDAQIKYISTTSNHSNYAKMVEDIFGPLTFASYSSVVYPPFSFIFYSLCILYSATQLLNRTLVKAQLYRLYHKFLNYLDKPTMAIIYQV
ncbi:hypothetical protein RDI58_020876 [Solanum bulbocastanum]|uniref:Uncharacterized protein n=1 Tax=Solanum bulbocastanum TaxID=147425 RepID=A0AAN8T7L8_SOLBU